VVGVAVDHVHVPAAFGQGALGQLPDLPLRLPGDALGLQLGQLPLAVEPFALQLAIAGLGGLQASLQSGVFRCRAGRRRGAFAGMADTAQFVAVPMQAFQAGKQVRLALQVGLRMQLQRLFGE